MGSRPPFDPWLASRPRDRRGLAVPYVNLWGEQTLANTRIAYDRHVGRDAVYVDDVGEVPNFLKQSPQRQRECMVAGLCQVCGREVPWSRRNIVLSGVSVEFVQVAGGRRAVVFEPWLDDRCAEIATRWCPALIRRRHDEDLTAVPVRSPREAQLVISEGWIEGPLEAATRARPVAMFAKVILLNHDIRPWSERTVTGG
jgi:hypothetical protein